MAKTGLFALAVLALGLGSVVWAQTPSEIERRISELEEKMRLIDPAFGSGTRAQDLLSRLDQLEQKLNGVLAKEPAPAPTAAVTPGPRAAPRGHGARPPGAPGTAARRAG